MNIKCLPKTICNHVVGTNHKLSHRMWVGVVFMAIGVVIAKASSMHDSTVFHFATDMVGYGVHGLGCTPFITYLSEAA